MNDGETVNAAPSDFRHFDGNAELDNIFKWSFSMLGFLIIMFIIAAIAQSIKKDEKKKQAEAKQKQWIEHQRLLEKQVHEGEVIDPDSFNGSPPPSRPSWKAQAAKAGAKILIAALIGQMHNHHNDHHRDS